MPNFSKVLIANRGEIAVRVINTARDLGYRTVAVYSEADAAALHVSSADEAVCIGPATVNQSYLMIDNIITAAKRSGADAIHPGYGFLSENAEFANRCAEEGLVFIGPSAEVIELMGSKRLSKIAMLEAGVPCIPGYQGKEQSLEVLLAEAEKIGFPLMVKASAGGGGRGMRLVFNGDDLEEQIKLARSEAENAFGSGELILERAVIEPRHVEIQVFADNHGNAVYLGERDCSIQRRHQKVVEEAPSPFVTPELRQKMGEAAVQAAKSSNYSGAGTVEFLVDADRNFYFLEMNTRLQVEHPVTELITGQDLVAWQLAVAAGQPLPLQQDEIQLSGHAVEVRLYAEDSRNNFMPQTGEAAVWEYPQRQGVRVDHGIAQGQSVTPHYDPMLAKIITWGENRAEACRKLASAVQDTTLLGVNNNKFFLQEVLRHPVFLQGEATTAFIEKDFLPSSEQDEPPRSMQKEPSAETLAIAAALFFSSSEKAEACQWQQSSKARHKFLLRCEGQDFNLSLLASNAGELSISRPDQDDAAALELNISLLDDNSAAVFIAGLRTVVRFYRSENQLFLDDGCGHFMFSDATHTPAEAAGAAGGGKIKASMDGAIVDLRVQEGDKVKAGDTVIVLEAMKMEHPLKSAIDGVVSSVSTAAGDQVAAGQVLAIIEAEDDA